MEQEKEIVKYLKLGKMTSKEIANWMQISYYTYRRNASKRLEYLKNFAKFTPCYGGVIIEEIYIDYYIKNISEDDALYLNEIRQCKDGLSTISGMVRKLRATEEACQDLSESTLRYRLTKAGDRTFGKTIDPDSKGSHGTRHYIWALKIDDYNHYRLMNDEERKIYQRIFDDFCADKKTQEEIEQDSLMLDAYKKKEISAKDYAEYKLATSNYFDRVIAKFAEETGYYLVRTTEHELYENQLRWEEEKKEAATAIKGI